MTSKTSQYAVTILIQLVRQKRHQVPFMASVYETRRSC